MKPNQPNWLKILYILIFLSVAGYAYWQQNFGKPQPDKVANARGEFPDETSVASTTGASVTSNPTSSNGSESNPTQSKDRKTLVDPKDQANRSSGAGTLTNDDQKSQAKNLAAKYGVDSFRWSKVERDKFTSKEGLIYVMGPRNEHRLEHIFRHTKNQPDRPGKHGVFDGNPDQVLTLLDQAYKLVKLRSPDVKSEQDGNRTVYEINLKKRIGYIGGQTGKRNDNPPARKIKLVLEGKNVVTAYPL